MTTRNIRTLETELRTALAAATRAQQRLIDAQREAGLHAPQHFWSWSEVKELLAEERDGWMRAFKALNTAPSQRKQSAFSKLAELAKAQPDVANLYSETPPPKKGK